MTLSGRVVIAAAATLVVTATIVAAVARMGSPAEARLLRLDGRRANDLRSLSSAVDLYRTRHRTLPATLDEIPPEQGGSVVATDPVTGRPYEYRAIDGSTYELCATFDRRSDEVQPGAVVNFWSHDAGRQCFTVRPRPTMR